MKWEYMIDENLYGHVSAERLNQQGEDGWELCGIVHTDQSTKFIYKRQKPQHP